MSDLREWMAQAVDRQMLGAFGITTAAEAPYQEPFTLDKLRQAVAALESIPPAPVFGSSEHYPADGFWTFEREGREYVLGHPKLWAQVPDAPRTHAGFSLSPLISIPIMDMDASINRELAAKIRFWIMTASRRPGEEPQWPKDVHVAPSR